MSENTACVMAPLSDLGQEQLQTLLDLVSDGIWDWNANTGHVYRNPGWYRMLGYPSHSLDNTVFTWENVIHPEDYPRVMACFEDYLSQRAPSYQVEYRCRCKDGSYLWIEDSGHVVARNPDGSVARMFGAHRNIDDRKRLVAHLEQRNSSLQSLIAERTRELCWVNEQLKRQLDENRDLAERDSLTLAANRYRLEKALLQECERAGRFRLPLSLILMDFDDFKPINDRYGHARGDTALVEVVEQIRKCVGPEHLLARWGGDEFMVLMPGSDLQAAMAVADAIRQQVLRLPPIGEHRVTLSFGIAQWRGGERPEQLVARADQALYRAKAGGKNQIA